MNATVKTTPATKSPQIRLSKASPTYWRVTFDNPPLNLMGPDFVVEFREIMTAIENDEHLRVVVFDSAVESFFLNHSDFTVKARGTDQPAARTYGAGSVARHTGEDYPRACRINRQNSGTGDRKRKRTQFGL